MKVLYPLYCAAACCLYAGSAHSYVSTSHSDPFLSYIQTKPLYAKSKPSLDGYTKYALVRFITDDGLTFSTDKGGNNNNTGGSGIPNLTPTADSGCTESAYPYTTDVTAQNCASTEQCFDGTTYRMKCTSCKDNMGLANGKCTCANSGYKYNDDNPCDPADYDLSIDKATCNEINNKGLTTTYYKACVCSSIYAYTCKETGQSPVGIGCSTDGGALKYVNCSCDSKYTQTCESGDVEPSGQGCFNTSTKKTLYMSCSALCDINKNEIKSWEDWWCGICKNQLLDAERLELENNAQLDRLNKTLSDLKIVESNGLTRDDLNQFETDLNELEKSLPDTLDKKQLEDLQAQINELRTKLEKKKEEFREADLAALGFQEAP